MTSRQQFVSRGVSCALAFSSSAFAADKPWDGSDSGDWNERGIPGVNGVPVKAGFADPAVVGALPNIAVNDRTISTGLRENFDGKVAGGGGLPGMAGRCEGPGVWLPDYNDTAPGFNGGGDLQTPPEDHGYITLTAVPEPAAALIGSLGLLALVRRRRG
jgi:hypothetical protein